MFIDSQSILKQVQHRAGMTGQGVGNDRHRVVSFLRPFLSFPRKRESRFILVSFMLVLSIATGASSQPAIKSIEPDTVYLGKTTDVKLKFDGSVSNVHLAVTPGGPFIKKQIPIALDQRDLKLKNGPDKLSFKNIERPGGRNQIELPLLKTNKKTFPKNEFLQGNFLRFILLNYNSKVDQSIKNFFIPDTGLLVWKEKNVAYLSESTKGFFVIDLSKPNSPEVIGSYDPGKKVTDFYVLEELVFFILDQKEIAIVDFKKPANPALITTYPVEGYANNLFVSNKVCFVANGKEGLLALDVSDPAKIKKLGLYNSTGSAQAVFIRNGKAYLADGEAGLVILDITDPTSIKWLGSHNNLGNVISLTVNNEKALAFNSRSHLMLLDVKKPEMPGLISSYRVEEKILGFGLENEEAIVITPSSLQWIDLSDEFMPLLMNEEVNLGGSRKVFIRDNIAYVADWFSGLHLYDISNPEFPLLISSFHPLKGCF